MARDPADIRNWQRRSDRVTTSGRLEAKDPTRLAAIGVSHVINLAMDDHPEALTGEEALLAELGIGYTHIPVPFEAPNLDHVAQLSRALQHNPGPVHVHCIANYRVTAFFYLLDLASGMSELEARRRMAAVWDPLSSDDPRARAWRRLLS